MTKLEGLLREADDRRVRLETRVADAQRLEWALRQRIEELERRLRDLGQAPPPSAAAPAQTPSAPRTQQPPVREPEARRVDGDDFASVLHQSILREQARGTAEVSRAQLQQPPSAVQAPPVQPVPLSPQRQAQAYLQQAPQARQRDEAIPAAPVQPPPPVPPTVQPVPEDTPMQEDEAIIKARALLRAGRTIEQVARETGVEIGALRLMRQMTQRD